APLAAEHRQLQARAEHYAPGSRAALSHLERSLFEPAAARVDPGAAVRLLEGGGERAELELVARELEALLKQGTPAEEIAVHGRRGRGPGASAVGGAPLASRADRPRARGPGAGCDRAVRARCARAALAVLRSEARERQRARSRRAR